MTVTLDISGALDGGLQALQRHVSDELEMQLAAKHNDRLAALEAEARGRVGENWPAIEALISGYLVMYIELAGATFVAGHQLAGS